MKKILSLFACLLAVAVAVAGNGTPADLTSGFISGSPEIRSVSALAFGPQGIIFIGDSKNAAVFAVDTKDVTASKNVESIELESVDKKIAAVFGTTPENISIQDMAVNPLSGKLYIAVHHADGTPALLMLEGKELKPVKLEDIRYSTTSISNAVGEDAKDDRGRSLRTLTITDLGFYKDKVMVTGLSNQEFSSSFRSIPFPFKDSQDQASLEIYHAAHGKYETNSPIKTFTPAVVGDKEYLIASYTCTPLVLFPMAELKAGKHVKGRTVAELGSWNMPLDMISMQKDGKSYLLLANSSRALMKIDFDAIQSYKESLTTPVEKNFATAGVDFLALPYTNVLQLDKLDDSRFVMLQRKSNGNLDLVTVGNRWF